MADTAPSVVINGMRDLITPLSEIGVVLRVPPWHYSDISERIVSEIGGVNVMRAWWFQGPTVSAEWLGEYSPQFVARAWTYEIHGFEGLAPAFPGDERESGGDLTTLRDNATRVMDALDADHEMGLGSQVFKSEPCVISDEPTHVGFKEGRVAGSYVVIQKVVLTVPAR